MMKSYCNNDDKDDVTRFYVARRCPGQGEMMINKSNDSIANINVCFKRNAKFLQKIISKNLIAKNLIFETKRF